MEKNLTAKTKWAVPAVSIPKCEAEENPDHSMLMLQRQEARGKDFTQVCLLLLSRFKRKAPTLLYVPIGKHKWWGCLTPE